MFIILLCHFVHLNTHQHWVVIRDGDNLQQLLISRLMYTLFSHTLSVNPLFKKKNGFEYLRHFCLRVSWEAVNVSIRAGRT